MARAPRLGLGLLRALSATAAILACGVGCHGSTTATTDTRPVLHIGALLPLTGPSANESQRVLDWAVEDINATGVAGHRLEVDYVDTATQDVVAAAKGMAADPSVLAVIGPSDSDDVMTVAPIFVAARKPLVTPSATSADVFRAFAGKQYIWRTVESDIAQARTLMVLAKNKGARRVAFVTSLDGYGDTFADWLTFFATELGITVTGDDRYEAVDTCDAATRAALAGPTDVLVAAPDSGDAACIATTAMGLGIDAGHMIFSDTAHTPDLVSKLGGAAAGIEGAMPAWAASTSPAFDVAHLARFGEAPTPFAAQTYDAAAILAYGLERSAGQGGSALADAMASVVDARGGPATSWDAAGIRDALTALHAGSLPDVSGATGPLEFDLVDHVDPVSSTYQHWRVDGGNFVSVELLDTSAEPGPHASAGRSAADTSASAGDEQTFSGAPVDRGTRTGLWASIVAASKGWTNYRHQADALAEYQILRAAGVSDDRIVLVLEDDVATSSQNLEPGVVRNVAGGPNVRAGATIDYALHDVGASDVLAILGGQPSATLPTVLGSGAGDDVLVFLVGHGDASGLSIGATAASDFFAEDTLLEPAALGNAVSAMRAAGRYRQMLIVVESCYGGALGASLHDDAVLFLAGANPAESSYATNFDPTSRIWLADEFAYAFSQSGSAQPTLGLDQLYLSLYLGVPGSHVTVQNQARFGGLGGATLAEFLSP